MYNNQTHSSINPIDAPAPTPHSLSSKCNPVKAIKKIIIQKIVTLGRKTLDLTERRADLNSVGGRKREAGSPDGGAE